MLGRTNVVPSVFIVILARDSQEFAKQVASNGRIHFWLPFRTCRQDFRLNLRVIHESLDLECFQVSHGVVDLIFTLKNYSSTKVQRLRVSRFMHLG